MRVTEKRLSSTRCQLKTLTVPPYVPGVVGHNQTQLLELLKYTRSLGSCQEIRREWFRNGKDAGTERLLSLKHQERDHAKSLIANRMGTAISIGSPPAHRFDIIT